LLNQFKINLEKLAVNQSKLGIFEAEVHLDEVVVLDWVFVVVATSNRGSCGQ
ncbi:hypothetical protein TorRG33x02_198630, partial [Trema orientale]